MSLPRERINHEIESIRSTQITNNGVDLNGVIDLNHGQHHTMVDQTRENIDDVSYEYLIDLEIESNEEYDQQWQNQQTTKTHHPITRDCVV